MWKTVWVYFIRLECKDQFFLNSFVPNWLIIEIMLIFSSELFAENSKNCSIYFTRISCYWKPKNIFEFTLSVLTAENRKTDSFHFLIRFDCWEPKNVWNLNWLITWLINAKMFIFSSVLFAENCLILVLYLICNILSNSAVDNQKKKCLN